MTTTQPTSETRALYESMSTEDLQRLQAAFEADMKAPAPSRHTIAFGAGRIALIEEVLAERRAGSR